MSFIIAGADNQDWQAASWIFNAFAERFIPTLRIHSKEMAVELETAIEAGTGYADFSQFLNETENQVKWTSAVNETIEEITKVGCSDWEDPSKFNSFIKKIKELKLIT